MGMKLPVVSRDAQTVRFKYMGAIYEIPASNVESSLGALIHGLMIEHSANSSSPRSGHSARKFSPVRGCLQLLDFAAFCRE